MLIAGAKALPGRAAYKLMSNELTRRDLLKRSGFLLGAGIWAPHLALASSSSPTPFSNVGPLIQLSLNENSYGPSPNVAAAIQLEFGRLNRYADEALARQLAEQIAEREKLPVEQVVLGEILELLGLYLGSQVARAESFSILGRVT